MMRCLIERRRKPLGRLWFACTFLLCNLLAPAQALFAGMDGSHVQFGTRAGASHGHGDGGLLLSASPGGSVFVAGYAEGARSDTGGLPPKPLVAEFDRNGKLLWQRVYDRVDWRIIGINANLSEPRVLFWRRAPYRHERDSRSAGARTESGHVELWALTPGGELGERLLTIEHDQQRVISSITDTGFTLWMSSTDYSVVPFGEYRNVRSFDWDGSEVRDSDEIRTAAGQAVFADDSAMLAIRQKGDFKSLSNTVVVTYRSGKTLRSDPIPGCGHCRFLDGRRNGSDFEIIVAPVAKRTSWRGLRLLSYDPVKGTVRVLAEWASLHGARVSINELPDGRLLLTGNDAQAALVASVAADRKLQWVRRFTSGDRRASLSAGIALRDGRLVITGLTGSHLMLDSEADSDAVLVVSDSRGKYLEQFGRCLVNDGSLATALYEMERKYAVTVPVHGFQYSSGPRADKPPIPASVVPPEECGVNFEKQLLHFLSSILEYSGSKTRGRVPEVASLTLEAYIQPGHPGAAIRYFPGDSDSGLLPRLVVDIDRPEVVATELAENIVPYIEAVTSAHAWLEDETGYYFQNGDPDGWVSMAGPWGPDVLSPREIASIAALLEESFEALRPSEKQAVRHYTADFSRVVIGKDDGDIRKRRYRGFDLPMAKADRFWQWILDDISEHAPRITELENQLRSRLGVTISERPGITPERYRAFLEELAAALHDLPDTDLNIRLEYYVEPNNAHILALWRGGRRVATVPADVEARDLAAWIMRIPQSE